MVYSNTLPIWDSKGAYLPMQKLRPTKVIYCSLAKGSEIFSHRLREQLTGEGTLKLCPQHSTTQDLYDHH